MKRFTACLKEICVLIAYIGPLALIVFGEFKILSIIIAGITFLYNALYRYNTSNIEKEFTELKYKYNSDIECYKKMSKSDSETIKLYQEQLDTVIAENQELRESLKKKQGK